MDAILEPEIRTQYLHIPTEQQQTENMHEVYTKYGLPNIIAGIDGCHIPFRERPRKIPGGRDHIVFINRKGFYSINAQIVGGIDRKIYDIQLTSPGSYHDAAVYQLSMFKGCICLSENATCAKAYAYAIQICSNIQNTQYYKIKWVNTSGTYSMTYFSGFFIVPVKLLKVSYDTS